MQTHAGHRWRRVFASLTVYFVCALATHASGLWQPMHADYSCWLRIARDWRSGAALYEQTYDNKLPWVYRWVGGLDSSRPEVSAYLAESVLAACGATLLAAALVPVFPRIAALVPLLLIVWSGTSETFYGGQTTEAPAMWFDVAALSCWALAARRGSRWWSFAAGGLLFLAVVFRPPAMVHVVAWLPLLWLAARRNSPRIAVRNAALAAAGSLAALAVFGLDALSGGWGGELLVVLARNARYAPPVPDDWAGSLFTGGVTLARILLGVPIAVVFLCVTLVVCIRSTRHVARARRCWLLVGLLWAAAAIVGAWPGGRHYAHYYHLLWPSLALLGALWLSRAWDASFSKHVQGKLALGIAAGCLVVAVTAQAYQAARAVRDRAAGTGPRTPILEAVDFLGSTTSENSPVVMHVWLDSAELYWRVPRPSPSYSIPHVLPAELYAQWVDAVLADPPAYIVWDGTPWQGIDGPPPDDVAGRLERLLAERYRPIKQFGPLTVLEYNNPN